MHLAAACLVAATGLAGCRDHSTPSPDVSPSARITIAVAGNGVPLGALFFVVARTRLIRLDQVGKPQPGLIESWSTSADHRTWTLRVRDGIRLQDGRITTTDDVVQRIRQELAAADPGPGLWDVTTVEQVGPHDIRIQLRAPTSLLFESLSLVPAVQTGPYRSEDETAPEPEMRAVTQPGEDPSAIGTVQVRRYETPRAAVAALLREDVDVLYDVPSEARDLLDGEEGVQLFPHVKPYAITLGFNHRHPILARRQVRLAMNAAIDRKALIAQVAGGVGTPAADMIWHQHWSRPHGTDAQLTRVDRQRAGQLLDDAGLHRKSTPNGRIEPRFRISCLVLDDPMMLRVAGRLQQAYSDIGIALDIEGVGLNDMVARLASGRFQTFVSPVVSGYGLSLPYVQFGAHGHPRVIDDGYTAAAEAAESVRAAATDEALTDAIQRLHRVLIEDPPAVPLFWQETSRAVGRRVAVPADWSGDVLGSLPRWTVRNAP